MKTKHLPRILCTAACVLLALSACRTHKSRSADIASVLEHSYEGVLPAADCPGIRTKLVLHGDKTAELSMFYIDRSTQAEIREASWRLDENGVIELWFPTKDPPHYFAIRSADTIVMLNRDKEEIRGELAEHYVLTRLPPAKQ